MDVRRFWPVRPQALALLGLIAMMIMVAFPAVDLTVSGWFFRPDQGFYLKDFPLFVFILKGMPPLLLGVSLILVIWGLAGDFLRTRFPGLYLLPELSVRAAAYLLASLAIGPGLIVNLLLKEHWGRARPGQILEFGGQAHYTAPLVIADQCVSNCSFSSGHGALGFWAVSLALLVPERWRSAAVSCAVAFGVLVGFSRIAQGGHFLSDTVFSALVVLTVSLTLHRVMLRGR